jgi:hypothetical protein
MGRACSTHGGEVHIGFWWGNLRERDHLEDPDVDIKISIHEIGWGWALD